MRRLSVAACLLAGFSISAPAQTAYHLAKKITVGGDGSWDYLVADTIGHRLFLSRGTHVMVMDTDRDTIIADILNTPGVHGIALAPQLGRGFTSNGRDSTVTVFDYKTLAPITVIKIPGANPDAILFEPMSARVFTFNGRSNDATVIDARTGAVVGTIPLGGKPEAANFDRGIVFVNIEDDEGKVIAFDAKTLAVKNKWTVTGCATPTGQGIDRRNTLLFLACGNNTMAVVNYGTGAVVTTIPIGAGTDGAAFDAKNGVVFSTNGGDGTITVVRMDAPNRFTVLANVASQRGARTIALDERTHKVYTVSAEFGPAPAPTPERPRPRGVMVPGSFSVLVLQPSTAAAKPKAPSLASQARISLDSATKIALARVPGTVKKHELEKEDGNFIYSFDIAVAGMPGVQEVWVSALDAEIVKVEHETPAMEKAEVAKEKSGAKAPVKKKP